MIEVLSSGESVNATTFNISAGGLCLLPSQSLPLGEKVHVELHLPDGLKQRQLQLAGEVVREFSAGREHGLIGLVFADPTPWQRGFLRDFVLRHALAQMQAISEYPAFRDLSDIDLLELASVSHELLLSRGDCAARFGDEATSVFLVKSGAVELNAPDIHDKELKVEVARAGQVFGEVSALLGLPHNLDVVAVEETELLVIPRAALSYLWEHSPRLALLLYEVFTAFMGRRVRRLTGRLVSPLTY